jgi:hypothetical protein
MTYNFTLQWYDPFLPYTHTRGDTFAQAKLSYQNVQVGEEGIYYNTPL